MIATTSVQRYLDRYAEPEANGVLEMDTGRHATVLVVPCYDEPGDCLDQLLPANATDLLVIVVTNTPDNAPLAMRARTLKLLHTLRSTATNTPDPCCLVPYAPERNVHLLVVDRVSGERRIPHRQGVGLARKVGADCALALMAAGAIRRPWIYATDADAVLPDDHLLGALPTPAAAALFDFRHVAADRQLQERADLYELHLRYYVNGLTKAGSPYAFHTLGSTMAIHAQAYAQVRGYPKRNAGEDFYLLNKLAKVGRICPLRSAPITLRARRSMRVPFGTGPALAKIPDLAGDYLSYAPASFEMLGEVLRGFAAVVAGEQWHASKQTDTVLAELGFFAHLDSARRQQRRPATLGRALHQWFDGFRTLRFIHECRRFHPDAPLLDTLTGLSATNAPLARDPKRLLQWLRSRETCTPKGVQ